MRQLVVNADDFGYSRSVNRGIVEAHERGIVTSASLMVDAAGAVEAAEYARRRPELGSGLHVVLGRWRVVRLPRRGGAASAAVLRRAAERQVTRQLERFRLLVGHDPTHLDSHQHRHRSEVLRPLFEQVAADLGVPLRHADPRVRFCGDFYGHDGRGRPDHGAIAPEALVAVLEQLGEGVTELGCHPGYPDDLDDWYRLEREQEVRTLCDPTVRAAVSRLGFELCTFDDVPHLTAGGGRA